MRENYSLLRENFRDLIQYSIKMKSMNVSPNFSDTQARNFQQISLSQHVLSHYRISALTFESRGEKLSAKRRLDEKLFHYLVLSAVRDWKSSQCCQKIIRRKISNTWAARRCNPHFGCVTKLVHKSFLLDMKVHNTLLISLSSLSWIQPELKKCQSSLLCHSRSHNRIKLLVCWIIQMVCQGNKRESLMRFM